MTGSRTFSLYLECDVAPFSKRRKRYHLEQNEYTHAKQNKIVL